MTWLRYWRSVNQCCRHFANAEVKTKGTEPLAVYFCQGTAPNNERHNLLDEGVPAACDGDTYRPVDRAGGDTRECRANQPAADRRAR